jgi:hypothetical protein
MYATLMDWLFGVLGIDPAKGKRVEEKSRPVTVETIKEVIEKEVDQVEPKIVKEVVIGIDFTTMTKKQLVEYAKDKNINIKMTMKKDDMIDVIVKNI